ncbi:MAG: hypothetical protein GXO98_06065 [Nitrospirae bacterium]|nr:hypothetical protein [Nitrospirota bacterium]
MKGIATLVTAVFIVGVAAQLAVGASAGPKVITFNNKAALDRFVIIGDVTIDTTRKREGAGSLKLAPKSKAVLKLRDTNGTGKVEFWVYEDGAAPAKPKAYGAGAMWGLMQADGRVLAVGPVYAPYLSGDKTYAVPTFNPGNNERPWQEVQYLGIRRKGGWHKWTFDFDPEKGLSILFDGKNVNARYKRFIWNKSKLNGFTSVVFFGGTTGVGQVLWVDDLSVRLGPASKVATHWPPPPPTPPAGLTVLAPLAKWNPTPYARWKNGPGKDESYFPIAVWLQDPKFASRYKDAGINLYIGLWKGPTAKQLAELEAAGMPVICHQNEYALKHLGDEKIIVGWMQGDEPDNAHRFKTYWKSDKEKIKEAWPEIYRKRGLATKAYRGYGPPVPPKWIVRDYKQMRKNDPTRPVFLGLGQGVAWNTYIGRGERRGHLEDYPEYIKGADIIAFDIYPVNETTLALKDALWYVPRGVVRLRKWCGDKKPVWVHIETGSISAAPRSKPTPHQVKAEVWMAIIHGARGIDYFVHQFKPKFNEHALLNNPKMLAAITAINKRIKQLAPVLNSPTITGELTVTSTNPKTPVHAIMKKRGGATYVFAVAMYQEDTKATFKLAGIGTATAEVIGEGRTVSIKKGSFTDAFKGNAVHLYRITE